MSEDFTDWFPNHFAASFFVIAFFLWAASELFNSWGFRRHRLMIGTQRSDRGSYWIILLVVWGSMTISFLAHSHNLGIFHNNLQYLGLGLLVFGIAFREWAVLSLGRSFTMVVSIVSGQTLVKRGPYCWLRHPAYSGSILTLVGFPLFLGTWAGGLVILILSFAAFSYRVLVEEKALLDFFGEEYRDYMQQTWRFFPGL
jgi:protein-S-isoprenylcysteine O-methyltransferase Ste14